MSHKFRFRHLLLGLACNESTCAMSLNISSNSLGQQGAHVLESCIHGVRVLSSLDISDNSMKFKTLSQTIKFCTSLFFIFRFRLRIIVYFTFHWQKSFNKGFMHN